MFESIGRFLRELFVKFVVRLPDSQFSYDEYISSVESFLGKVNYWIPIYLFKQLFNVWAVTVFGGFGIYLLLKYIKKLLGL